MASREQDGQQKMIVCRAEWPAERRIASREQNGQQRADGQQRAGWPAASSMANMAGWPAEEDGQQSRMASRVGWTAEQNGQKRMIVCRAECQHRAGRPAESRMVRREHNGQQRAG